MKPIILHLAKAAASSRETIVQLNLGSKTEVQYNVKHMLSFTNKTCIIDCTIMLKKIIKIVQFHIYIQTKNFPLYYFLTVTKIFIYFTSNLVNENIKANFKRQLPKTLQNKENT